MKVTVNTYLNARTGPSTSHGNPSFRNPGDIVELKNVLIGEVYDGSAIWYLIDDANYYWSGGFTETSFFVTGKLLNSFDAAEQQLILKEVCKVYANRFANSLINFVKLQEKSSNVNGSVNSKLELLLTSDPGDIPATVDYKGIQISLDVVVVPALPAQSVVSSFDDLNVSEKKRILNEAKRKHMIDWSKTFSGIQSVKIDYKKTGTKNIARLCLVFQVKEKEKTPATEIPTEIKYQSDDGRLFLLPTDVESVGETINHVTTCEVDQVKRPGCSVGRDSIVENGAGTIGLKVFRPNTNGGKDFFILSCYHVLCAEELNNGITDFKNSQSTNRLVVSPAHEDGFPSTMGEVQEGLISDKIDAAIARLNVPNTLSAGIADMGNAPLTIRQVSQEDENRLTVKLSGRTSGFRSGDVIDSCTFVSINYPVIGTKKIHDVIMTTKMSDPGDSGACVLDLFDGVIGLIVASNSKYSYVIPIKTILDKDNLNINICFP